MIPRLHKRGKSFKETCRYVLNDPKADTNERVGWTMTRNLMSRAEDAWFEMLETANNQQRLKTANGVDARGRKNTSPVQHLSLSWAPGENPSPALMQQAALSCLAKLGLQEHEALIVAHTDKEHQHVHIVVNTIHPLTGRTAELSFAKRELSSWAAEYEREHGVHCAARGINAKMRAELKAARTTEAERILNALAGGDMPDPRAPYIAVKDHSLPRTEWMLAKVDAELDRLASDILDRLVKHDSTFTRHDIARQVSEETLDEQHFSSLLAKIEGHPDIVHLPGDGKRLSTRSMLIMESEMSEEARAMHGRTGFAVAPGPVPYLLSADQRAALTHVTGPDQLAAVVGLAGSGKSTMLGEALKLWEVSGFDVRGAALSGIAAEGLQQGSGIRSSTIHALTWAIENGHESIGRKTVLVVDEAGMVSSRQMHKLLMLASKAGAKVVLVGDPEQLRPIEAGAAFRAIVDEVGAARITEIRRQKVLWQRTATAKLAQGHTEEALRRYQEAGNVHGHRNKDEAVSAVVAAWSLGQKDRPDTSSIMLASTNAAVLALNAEARRVRRSEGKLGADKRIQAWEDRFDAPRRTFALKLAVGDQLMFTKNDKRLGVKNGTIGTLVALDKGFAFVRLGGKKGPVIPVNLAVYRNFRHGYAVTIHKAQGMTTDKVHVLASKNMDRNLTYVAMSRHRDQVSLHYAGDEFAGFGALVHALKKERLKDTTMDYFPERSRAVEPSPEIPVSPPSAFASDRIRLAMAEWRKRNPSRDFGLEL